MRRCGLGEVVAFGVRGEGAGVDVCVVLLKGLLDEGAGLGVLADEFWRGVGSEAQEVMPDEDLAVTVWACADADGGDGELAGEGSGDLAGDAFKDD